MTGIHNSQSQTSTGERGGANKDDDQSKPSDSVVTPVVAQEITATNQSGNNVDEVVNFFLYRRNLFLALVF